MDHNILMSPYHECPSKEERTRNTPSVDGIVNIYYPWKRISYGSNNCPVCQYILQKIPKKTFISMHGT